MMYITRSIKMRNFYLNYVLICDKLYIFYWMLVYMLAVIHDMHTVQMKIFYWMFSCTAIFLFCYTVISKYSSVGILIYITV